MGKTNKKSASSKDGNPQQSGTSTATFEYKQLEDTEIRLMKILPRSWEYDIHCSLVHKSSWRRAPYVALSYCWGNPSARQRITLNEQSFFVTENLFDALQAIVRRRNRSRWYWIDAICIDQQNVKEKTVQVRKMGDIYRAASLVFSWLGSAEETAVWTLATREQWLNSDSNNVHHPMNDKVIEDAVTKLLDSEYFQRTWIIPEFINAPRIQILAGLAACSTEYLHSCCISRQSIESRHNNALQLLQMRHGSYHNNESGRVVRKKELTLDSLADDCRIFEASFKTKCGDRRDCVFAMASQIEGVIEVDYSLSPAEVFVITLERLDRKFASTLAAATLESVPLLRDLFRRIFNSLVSLVRIGRGPRPSLVEWLQARKTWDCSQLPFQIGLPSGRLLDCSGPIWKYVLQGDIDIAPSDEDPDLDNQGAMCPEDVPSLSNPPERPVQPSPRSDKQKVLTQELSDAKDRLAAVDQQLQDLHLDYDDERKARAMQSADQKALEMSDSDFEAAYEEMFAEAERERRAALLAQEAADDAYWRGHFCLDGTPFSFVSNESSVDFWTQAHHVRDGQLNSKP